MKDALGRYLRNRRICAVLPYITGRLLDIACGTNALVRAYDGQGLGTDVYQWGDVDLIVQDSSTLPLGPETFDTVTITAAPNPIPDRKGVLAEAFRVLKPSGIIITMLRPFVSRLWHLVRKPWDADQKERGMRPGEVFGMTPKQVRRLLIEAGFRLTLEKRFMLGLNRLTIAEKPCAPFRRQRRPIAQ